MLMEKSKKTAKPFMKWAGGKGQLLKELAKRIPKQMAESKTIEYYLEPFLGGGAFFFYLYNNYDIKKATLIDINRELIVGYKVIKNNHKELIDRLKAFQEDYFSLEEEKRKEFYYKKRKEYNEAIPEFDFQNYNESWIDRAVHMIFLNRTCFNGLTRQNSKGEFNVPFGRYKNPRICDGDNILQIHEALKIADVFQGEFDSIKNISNDKDTFVYFDPPYRPLSDTANFTSYAKEGFDDDNQNELRKYFEELVKQGAYVLLSNSDPRNTDPDDNFFDNLYQGYKIERVKASRMINCDPSKRGKINELLITSNYSFGVGNPKYQKGTVLKK